MENRRGILLYVDFTDPQSNYYVEPLNKDISKKYNRKDKEGRSLVHFEPTKRGQPLDEQPGPNCTLFRGSVSG